MQTIFIFCRAFPCQLTPRVSRARIGKRNDVEVYDPISHSYSRFHKLTPSQILAIKTALSVEPNAYPEANPLNLLHT